MILQCGRGNEGGREIETSVGCLCKRWTRDEICNLGMCTDWELNPLPSGEWNAALTARNLSFYTIGSGFQRRYIEVILNKILYPHATSL